jgi:hypothetical protein
MNFAKIKKIASQFMQGYQGRLKSKEVIIDRKNWIRGEGMSCSKLLRISDQKRCCLGFYLSHLGVSDEEMLDVGQPCGLPPSTKEKYGNAISWLFEDHDGAVSLDNQSMVHYNDKPVGSIAGAEEILMTEWYREEKLTELFARNGVSVRFVN